MLAYHNDAAIKQFYIDRLTTHYNADEIIKGKYWEQGKGCAVGCIIHGSNHLRFSKELGIPVWFARVAIDQAFENLPNRLSKEWPLRIMQAIPVGGDLDPLLNPLLLWIVKRAKSYITVDQWGVIPAIDAVRTALKTGVGLSEAASSAWVASASAFASWASARRKAEDWKEAWSSACAAEATGSAANAKLGTSDENGAEATSTKTALAAEATSRAARKAEELFWINLADEIIRLLGDTHVSIS